MVETIFHINRLLCLNCFALRFGLGPFQKTLLLFSFVLRPVLEEHLEKVCCKIFIKRLSELVKSRWNLQPLLKDPLLPLNLNIFRPFHKPCQISLWWQSTTDPKLLRPLLKKWVHHFQCGILLRCCNWCFSTALWCHC
uniref:Uncharacterized protein n=1 Tax=Medicago truncatula TaxID=3880 RepID=I3SZA9_MEDTR|nr:unknown [Medicago truncatula]